MSQGIFGLHHITAMSGMAQKNVDFYVGVLGLRMVKKTVNFDAPDVYHFYYGDTVGSPGTIMTFFPFGEGPRGNSGADQATVTSFSIRKESLAFWTERLKAHGISFSGPEERSNQRQVITFRDPDGIALELVAHEGAESRPGWQNGPVPSEHAIRGFYGVTIKVRNHEQTSALLTDVMGFRLLEQKGERYRYEVGEGGPGTIIDVISQEDARYGRNSIGTIHHIAWRVANEDELRRWQSKLMGAGMHVTEVKDRNYFKSVYFREPGGVLFELASDPPGFAIDESVENLGTDLKLPEWFEPNRSAMESQLPPIHLPVIEGK
ncbi:ring-cleaving dioxygenase [Alicyclobacillus fastidiosus]|uniref:Ring-cleaving dioxygenase n=1 Tax=Alicyclobacillus fastidiosus TaxID=392011 RepID=A0ABY6ZBN2_9BACL|nr:ring-cleaving dioxygenase [Alicyclobacillus fastidiosus]WAH40276.1 ring-cleaving dioxygenase [Alicyclobacillus fastidiosus]GMA61652.1 diguanylate cyclase [Alicyclobacillus fastidiosus]